MQELLEVKNLSVSFDTPAGELHAVRDVSFSLKSGEVLAIVGESGCGKSVLCKSIMKLLPRTAKIKSGTITACGTDITRYRERDMNALRGKLFSMVFQDPMTALDPTMTVGAQIAEAVRRHQPKLTGAQTQARVLELMTLTGISRPAERMRLYPYHFSGGMRQRAVMAIALAGSPKILFADEPTTALDVTIQAQIMDLLVELKDKINTAIILITHDLGVVAGIADRVAVMYAGKVVETGTTAQIFYEHKHPYTEALLRSLPSAEAGKREPLMSIPGTPPDLLCPPKGCGFAARCRHCMQICREEQPPEFELGDGHKASCWLLHPDCPCAAERGDDQ